MADITYCAAVKLPCYNTECCRHPSRAPVNRERVSWVDFSPECGSYRPHPDDKQKDTDDHE